MITVPEKSEDGRFLCSGCDDFFEERNGDILDNGQFWCEECQDKEENEDA